MKNLPLLFLVFLIKSMFAQTCDNTVINWVSDIDASCNQNVMTMAADNMDRPYLYLANKEGGLAVYDISDKENPIFLSRIDTANFEGLHAMNLHQDGNYLYLAVGNHFNNSGQNAGMVIVDITSPSAGVSVTDYYTVPNSNHGAGIVKTEGDYAYLGAMNSGVVVLNVTNKSNIQFEGQFIPDINFPPINNPNPDLYNARGMAIENSIVYLCYDAGGIRIIDCTDKRAPTETGKWCNPTMYQPFNRPRAYNNIVLDDTLAYVAVDYAGVEVLNIKDTSNIEMVSWWNPYNAPANNWFTSPMHTNEIVLHDSLETIFLSTGKGDMIAVDISDPYALDSCNFYGGVDNSIGTWGISMQNNNLYLSYICTLGIPFSSNWSGVKILELAENTSTNTNNYKKLSDFKIYPNPAQNSISISENQKIKSLSISNINGKNISKIYFPKNKLDISFLENGVYFVQIRTRNNEMKNYKIIKNL